MKKSVYGIFPLMGLIFGHFLDVKETQRMTMFRDKSALYGFEYEDEDQEPSW